jgi:hypothetical protein
MSCKKIFLSQEPRYEYDFPLPYIRSWNNYYVNTIQKGFNEFLDRHRDPKDIQKEVLEVRIVYRDQRCDPVVFWPLDPGSGSVIRDGMNIQYYFSEGLETVFRVKILEFFDADPDPGSKIWIWYGKIRDPRSGINILDPQIWY